MKNGILTSNSAGNEGSAPESISNCSPWSLSVGASTTDRKFTTGLKLGNGKFYQVLRSGQHGQESCGWENFAL